jgi:NADPH:quinone reductase-like Zn-dependent oxidoreductase
VYTCTCVSRILCAQLVLQCSPQGTLADVPSLTVYACLCVMYCPAGGIDVAAASCVPIVYGTAHLALRLRANLQPGQTVLVLGASGGVGTAAIQVGWDKNKHLSQQQCWALVIKTGLGFCWCGGQPADCTCAGAGG